MIGLLHNFRRRKLVQWLAAYVAAAWALLQLLGLVVDSYDWPHMVMHVGFAVAILGLVIACVLAWYHGERGAQKISGPELLIIALLLAIGGGLLWRSQGRPPAAAPPAVVATQPTRAVVAVPAIPDKSIAVLPFENLSGRAEDAYLADGLQEEILNALARVRDIKVISRTSVAEFRGKEINVREIGQRLGVRTVLEGSVRLQGNKLRLTIQLIDARDDHHLLATNYDRELTNVLDLQTAVARLVADALSATLTAYERGELDRVATNSGDAYDKYLRALAIYNNLDPSEVKDMNAPQQLLEQSLAIDPEFADAWALLSQVDTWTFYNTGSEPATGLAAKHAYERALELDPDLPEAILARGAYSIYVTRDLPQAISDLDAVVKRRPNSADAQQMLGLALRRQGRMDEALGHLVRAWDLDPLNHKRDGGPIITLLGLRRYPEAIEQTRLDLVRFPGNPDNYFARARLEGRLQHSLEPLRAALRDHGRLLDDDTYRATEAEIAQDEGRYIEAIALWAKVPVYDPLARGRRMGLLYLAAGDPGRARIEWQKAERFESGKKASGRGLDDMRELALVQSLLGEHEKALATIERSHAMVPEASDALNGPAMSFARAIILVRAGRRDEGIAEATRLLKVPFGAPFNDFFGPEECWDQFPEAKQAPFDELINHPPRL